MFVPSGEENTTKATPDKVGLCRRQFLHQSTGTVGILAAISGCTGSKLHSGPPTTDRPSETISPEITELWNDTMKGYLHDSLWDELNRYDAGHIAMVPFHAAFHLSVSDWKRQIRSHVNEFTEEGLPKYDESSLQPRTTLAMLQYLHLIGRYIALEVQQGNPANVPRSLPSRLAELIEYLWKDHESVQWGHSPFTGMRERLQWKFEQTETDRKYYQAIIYPELFLFALTADVGIFFINYGGITDLRDVFDEILTVAEQVYRKFGETQPDGGWLFQPGLWADYPDLQYACHTEKKPDLEPCTVDNIARDSSHSMRHPRWIQSLREIAVERGNRNRVVFYETVLNGFRKQFIDHVLVPPSEEFPTYRTTNYMDGRNGLYRWEYETAGENHGYGPFELSGSLTFGWWTFLHDSEIARMYSQLSNEFPLSEQVLKVYIGPNTSRERNSLVELPVSYHNGLRKLLISLAAQLQPDLS